MLITFVILIGILSGHFISQLPLFHFSLPGVPLGQTPHQMGTHPAPLVASQHPFRKILVLSILLPLLVTDSTPEIIIVQHCMLILVPNILYA